MPQIIGTEGNDFLVDATLDDEILALGGDDEIIISLGIDNVDGGEGFDLLRLDFSQSLSGVTSLLTGSNSGQYSDGVNTVTFSNIEAIEVFGSQFDDVLAALPFDGFNPPPYYPIIDGGLGIDQLLADFSSSSDDLNFYLNDYGYESGSLQVDNYFNGIYQNIDFYSMESFAITSGSGNDYFDLGYNNYSDDTVNAGAGDDYIFTGFGIDNVDGGEGFDVLRLDYYQSPSGVTSFLTGSNSGQYSDGVNTVTFSNIEAIEVFGSQFEDVLKGLNGNDILYGGEGKDRIYGGNGDDILYGGAGKDIMFGDAGMDIFALEANLANSDRNVIKDFSDGEDRLGLTFGLAFEDLSITNNSSGSATLIRDASNDNDLLAVIRRVDAADITIDDFVNI